ncbi:hypothetical protein BpHYR1_052253 [Brachionus plicatilis]|uniref:Uncharacterized protein n=1 Tax=Brachionus plicatilis TaxID=10195 RepID=A0A3M7TA27_BRAPC|nr:hypothetical protein BpHYR1_052253 [Brachionus plicatilis]
MIIKIFRLHKCITLSIGKNSGQVNSVQKSCRIFQCLLVDHGTSNCVYRLNFVPVICDQRSDDPLLPHSLLKDLWYESFGKCQGIVPFKPMPLFELFMATTRLSLIDWSTKHHLLNKILIAKNEISTTKTFFATGILKEDTIFFCIRLSLIRIRFCVISTSDTLFSYRTTAELNETNYVK